MLTLEPWALDLIAAQRIAHLATVGAGGQPSALPVVYAFDGASFVTPLDGKPKQVELARLRRVRDIAANPRVALVIDQYDEDWSRLAWVQVRGAARVIAEGDDYDRGVTLLAARYPQYAIVPLAGRPLILIAPAEVRCWRAARWAEGCALDWE